MKKLLIPVLAVAILAACSDRSEIPVTQDNRTVQTVSTIRSVDDAASLAGQLFGAGDPGSRTTVKVDRSNVHAITSVSSRAGASDTILYAVDNADGGFALIAAPYNVEPILAIIDEGSYTDPENLTNEPYQQALAKSLDYVQAKSGKFPITIPDGPVKPVFKPLIYWDSLRIDEEYAPVVQVAWGQDWPENFYTPNGAAGCVPVAIAQMMSVFKQPQNISYTFPNRDMDAESIDWDNIVKHKRSKPEGAFGNYCSDCVANTSTHYTLARIIRENGQRLPSEYTYTYINDYIKIPDTRTKAAKIEPYIRSILNKSPNSSGEGFRNLFNAMCANKAVAITGACLQGDDIMGHCWVADGVKHHYYVLIEYELDPVDDIYISHVLKETNIELIHFNWGYGGVCNGWFNIGALDTDLAEEYDYPNESNKLYTIFNGSTLLYWVYRK